MCTHTHTHTHTKDTHFKVKQTHTHTLSVPPPPPPHTHTVSWLYTYAHLHHRLSTDSPAASTSWAPRWTGQCRGQWLSRPTTSSDAVMRCCFCTWRTPSGTWDSWRLASRSAWPGGTWVSSRSQLCGSRSFQQEPRWKKHTVGWRRDSWWCPGRLHLIWILPQFQWWGQSVAWCQESIEYCDPGVHEQGTLTDHIT